MFCQGVKIPAFGSISPKNKHIESVFCLPLSGFDVSSIEQKMARDFDAPTFRSCNQRRNTGRDVPAKLLL